MVGEGEGEGDGDVDLVGLGAPVWRAEIGERIVGRRPGLCRKDADQAKAVLGVPEAETVDAVVHVVCAGPSA